MEVKNERVIKFLKNWKELLNTSEPDLVTLFMAMANTKYLINLDCIIISQWLEEKGYDTLMLKESTFIDKLKPAIDKFIGMSHITGSTVNKVNWLEFCKTYLYNYCGLTLSQVINVVNMNSKYLKARIDGQEIIIDIN